MRRFILAILLLLLTFGSAQANVMLYVDAAPNAYGSPDYAGWETAAFSAVKDGTFVNMASSSNPSYAGTTNFTITDEVVYSFGDLGKRLTWIYWIPNTTIAELTGNFEIKLENWWDGEYLDFYDDYYGDTWLEPTKWQEYEGGVIGTAGMAWWGAYGVNTQEALDADLAAWAQAAETWKFTAMLTTDEYDALVSIKSNRTAVTPIPGAVWLLGTGLLGLVGLRSRFMR